MRDAEDLALHRTLAVGNDRGKARLQRLDHIARIHAFRNLHGSGCRRGRGGREQLEAQRDKTGAGCRRVQNGVVNERDAAFFEVAARLPGNVIQRRAQAGNQRHGRRVGAFALGRVLALLAQVKIVARIPGGIHRLPRPLAHAEVGQARRNHDRLLRAADEHVDAPAVDVKVRGAQAGDAVNHQQCVGRSLVAQPGNGLHVVVGGGRSLRSLQEDSLGVRLDGGLYRGQVEGLPVGNLHHFNRAAKGLGQVHPALAELASR